MSPPPSFAAELIAVLCLAHVFSIYLLSNKLHNSIAVMIITPAPVIHAAKMIGA